MSTATVNQLSLAPLGAGDLIDRAVRLYRRHFITLIRIAAPHERCDPESHCGFERQ
ncbi:MAG: hypothetical protein LC775_12015 [Acidobacteria bacterium]|nr:hypothetical protein [Acidobacteriota bacterium]